MSEALPALIRGLINSVIALRGNPPPIGSSRKGNPVIKCVAAASDGCGKRSASRFRRSIISALVAMEHQQWHVEYLCSSEHNKTKAHHPERRRSGVGGSRCANLRIAVGISRLRSE